jgi:hypothetical protein
MIKTPSIEKGVTISLVIVFEGGKENHFSHGERFVGFMF